jgi:transposase
MAIFPWPWPVTACRADTGRRVRHKDQMPVISPYLIVLASEEEPVLIARAQSVRGACCDRLRARIVPAAAAGMASAAIAVQAGVHAGTARKWRRRFAAARLAGLKDAPRSGRPPVFTAADRAETVALACALPAGSGVPLSRWSCPELARELAARCQIAASASSIRRWLAADALKPWQHRSWISVRDPAFAAKARAMRIEHGCNRGGALACLAARDVHRGQVTGRCEHTTGIAPFSRLAEQVMTSEPHASANRVSWIAGNGSSHRGAASIKRMARAWPNAHLIHLPTHASWLDQAGDLLLHPPAQSPHTRRLHQPGPDPPAPRRARDSARHHRQAVQLELHTQRP